MKIINTLITLFFSQLVFAQAAPNHITPQSLLYEGEQLLEVNKVQTLFKYIKGDDTKPLIIFIPGDSHLARISYGFPGGKDEDFLSYWLNKKGYPFLGVSYPTDNPVFKKTYPAFNIRNWGNQVATLARSIIDENHLTNHVVVLAAGMGGNIEESVSEFLGKNHILLDSFIAMSARAPLLFVMNSGEFRADKMFTNHLADRTPIKNRALKFLEEQNDYNGHEIIPKKTFNEDFIGNVPVALEAEGYFYNNNTFEYDVPKALEDAGVFNFKHTPWIGIINDDSTSMLKITLTDPSLWTFIRGEMLYQQYIYYMNIENNQGKFSTVKRILGQIPSHFSDAVHGNHFFFLGKKGAYETAQKVDVIMQRINTTKQNIIKLALD